MKKKISAVLVASMITTNVSPTISVFANEITKENTKIEAPSVVNSTEVKPFDLTTYSNFEGYNEEYKLSREDIKSITNNGGKYASSTIDKAIDGNLSTHWETGTPNGSTFKNEVTFEFNNIEIIDRIAYSTRQDSAKGKGFPTEFDIYASVSGNDEDLKLVSSGKYSSTGNMLEFKFDTISAKKVKFVFKEANQGWASASEFWFYREDKQLNRMNKIFTNNSRTELAQEFNTLEKLSKFEEEVKSHPFYESIVEDINDARLILEGQTVVYKDAIVSKFKNLGSTELVKYDELFKVQPNKITTNGGHYGSSNVEKAIDGKADTSWHSGRQNNNDFTNEVILTLDEITTLDKIVYTAGAGTHRGFAEAFDIYASKTSKGDSFELVSKGTSSRTNNSIEIKFNPTNFKRIKFVFKKGYENWALASEFGLYKQDILAESMDNIFTNGLMDELSESYNTIEELTALENEAKSHPFYEDYKDILNRAKEVINNNDSVKSERLVVGEQRGHYTTESGKRMINGAAYSSFEPFGKYVTAGEEIVVYVDADPNGKLPQLCYGQVGKGKGDWRRWADLKPGRNVLKVPENINPSALYLVNQARPEEQAYAPKVRIEGGTKFPTYFHGETDPQAFRKELENYAKNLELSDEAFANGSPQGKVFNIAEFVSENVVITTSALGAIEGLKWAEQKDLDISDTMTEWENMYEYFQTFMGYKKDAEDEKDTYFPNKFIARVFYGVPLGFADHGYTGYLGSDNAERNGGFFKLIAAPPNMKGNDNWAYTHEFGHIFNTKYIVDGEVTNNLYAQEYRRLNADKGINGDRAAWGEIMKRFKGEEHAMHYFERLAVLSQLNIAYGYDAYAKASQALRNNTELIRNVKGSDTQRLVIAYSIGLGVDLTDFFGDWGYVEITEQMKDTVKHLPKPSKKLEYLHGGAYDYKGNGFTEDIKVNVNANLNKEEKATTLNFDVDKENKDDVLGYEILKGGKFVGYTKDSTFTIKDVDVNENAEYEIIAYAKDLSMAKGVKIRVFKPTLSIEENITIALGSEFDAKKYVTSLNYEGEVVENIEIEHNVDTSKKGSYEVKYKIVDNDIEVSKVAKVNVVSQITYLSDVKETSAKVGWGIFRKDVAPNNTPIELDRQGVVARYTKGLGAHADSTVVYDLENKGYDKFESYIGIDQSMRNNSSSSASFKVYLDGEEVYSSSRFGSNTDHEFISIDLNGAKELKLVTEDHGNNSADQTVWADAKFTSNDTKPEIFTEDLTIEVGEDVDVTGNVTASDKEDGDLSSKVEIVSNNFKVDTIGRFKVVYKVTDSDGNVSEKCRYITAYETFDVNKSKYGSFNKLDAYNEQYKIPVFSVKNNAGNYGGSVIAKAIDNDLNTHWETNSPNNDKFKNEVIFDLGESKEINRMSYAARKGGKGFATSFSVYVSNEAEGNDFILAGKGQYKGNTNDVIEFKLNKTDARRVKFVFDSAREEWASIGEMSFYKKDTIVNKIESLFTDTDKTQLSPEYNTLDKLNNLKEEVKNHPGNEFFQDDFNKAESLIRDSFPTLNIPNGVSTKVGVEVDVNGEYSATDNEDGDITSSVIVEGNVNFNKSGKYKITYSVTDSDGNTTQATREIKVVDMEDYKYISDIDWKSVNNTYGRATKDISASGNALRLTNEDGSEVVYEKGIGTHSTSTIIYDLTKDDYGYFTSYIGVDRQMFGSVGSVAFQVYLDDEKVYDSGLMNSRDAQKYVELNLKDAKELKLVVTDGKNGNGSDHATWGDTKLHFAKEVSISEARENLQKLVDYANTLDISMVGATNHIQERWDNFVQIKDIVEKFLADFTKTDEELNLMVLQLNYVIEELYI